jgi:hypothetical protein
MEKKCHICGRIFTRKWNLQRHVDEVHNMNMDNKIEKNRRNNERYDQNYDFILQNTRNNNFQQEFNRNEIQNNQHNYGNHNYGQFPNYGNSDFGPYYPSYFESQFKLEEKERKLSINEMIKIQQSLKILGNHLEKRFPPIYVSNLIQYYGYVCSTEKSIQPLKKLFDKLGLVWPYFK